MLLKGKTFYCRILGAPHAGFDKNDPTQNEWSFDLCLTPETKKQLTDLGLKSHIKNKGDNRGDFITFKRRAVKKDGTPAKPIRVVDHNNNLWNGDLIGNDSILNVSFTVNETVRPGGVKYLRPSVLAVQVWDHIKYEPKSEFPTDSGRPSSNFDVSEDAQEEWN